MCESYKLDSFIPRDRVEIIQGNIEVNPDGLGSKVHFKSLYGPHNSIIIGIKVMREYLTIAIDYPPDVNEIWRFDNYSINIKNYTDLIDAKLIIFKI